MADPSPPPASSQYRGIRATITASADGRAAFLSLSAKRVDAPWSEWDSLTTAIRLDLTDVASTRDALMSLARAITDAAELL